MAFEQPDPSEDASEYRVGGTLRKLAPLAALAAALILMIFLLSLAY